MCDKWLNKVTRLSRNSKRNDDDRQLLLCSAPEAIHPYLPSHGSTEKMSDHYFKVHHSDPFYDERLSFICALTKSLSYVHTEAHKHTPCEHLQ